MQIRAAKASDVQDLVRLWTEFMDFHSGLRNGFMRSAGAQERWAKYIGGIIADADWLVLVAEYDGALAGYIVSTLAKYPPIFTIESYGFVQEIAVDSRCRRRGLAKRLYGEAEAWLRARGAIQIQVKVDVGNEPSRRFWENEGFIPHVETMMKQCDGDP